MKTTMKRIFSLLIVLVMVCGMLPVVASAAETTYTFSSYASGTQYAENEVHVLDDNVTVVTTQCHFTSELRIYSSGEHNGYAIINCTSAGKSFAGLTVNAGNKADTLNLYGSNDNGANWTLIGSVSTSGSYKDLTYNFNGNTYTSLKLDVAGTSQVRVKKMTVTLAGGCSHNYTGEITTAATCTEAGEEKYTCSLCGDSYTEVIPATGHNYVLNEAGTTYNCENCTDSFDVFKIHFSVPAGEAAVDDVTYVVGGITMPTGNNIGSYTFAGWTDAAITEEITTAPGTVYAAGQVVEFDAETTLHALYTRTEGSTATEYEKKALADIGIADQFVIVGTNATASYALTSANGSSSAPGMVTVTAADDKLSTVPTEAILWTLSKDGENYTFHPNGDTSKWLYCTNDNNGVRVGTGDAKTFVLDASGYLKNVTQGRYLGIYNNQDWRCYTNTTGNIANQSFTFYAKAGATIHYTTTIGCNHVYEGEVTTAATCTTDGLKTYTCSACGDSYEELILATGHSYDEGTVTAEPSCTATGVKTFTCSVCNETTTEEIPANGHSWVGGTCSVCGEETDYYTLVTNASSLAAGDKIIIVAADYDFALSTNQGENNRAQAAVTKGTDGIAPGSDVQIITLEAGAVDGTFAFSAGTGYLYAAASDKNYLRTQDAIDENASWLITIDSNGVATIKAQGANTNNWLRYNNSSSIFSCYGETSSQKDVAIYKLAVTGGEEGHVHNYTEEITTAATCTTAGVMTYTCDVEGCDNPTYTEEIPALGHNWVDGACSVCGEEASGYVLVTDASSLAAGDKIIIVAKNSEYALSTEQRSNNRGAAAVTKVENSIEPGTDVQIITLEAGTVDGTFAFNVGTAGYLYAASGTSNHLKTQTTKDANASWLITIAADGVATIKAQGTNSRNWLRYNSGNNPPIFSCYGSGQTDVAIYKSVAPAGEVHTHNYVGTVTTEPTCTTAGVMTYTCDVEGCDNPTYTEAIPATHDFSMGDCSCGHPAPDSTITIAEANQWGMTYDKNTYSTGKYYIEGTIESIDNTEYGNMYIQDADGTELFIYGLYSADGKVRFDAMDPQPAVGDTIKIYTVIGTFNGTEAQAKSAWLIKKVDYVDTYNVELSDKIGMNFKLTADVTSATVTFGGKTTTVDLTNLPTDENGLRIYNLKMAAVQMTEKVTWLFNGKTEVSYSVRGYADEVLAGEYGANVKAMAQAMLHYGAAAQNYFDYNKGNLANLNMQDTASNTIQAAEMVPTTGSTAGIVHYGSSLVYRDRVAVRVYFKLTGDAAIGDYTFTANGENAEANEGSNGLYYVEVADIAPQNLDEAVTVVVNDDLTVTYSPLNYIYRMSQKSDDAALKTLLQQLYDYYMAAEYLDEFGPNDFETEPDVVG